MQMLTSPIFKMTTKKRSALWNFEKMSTLRHRIIQRAGRLTWPQGKLTLTMNNNVKVQQNLMFFLDAMQKAA